jgi:hypothetical protein
VAPGKYRLRVFVGTDPVTGSPRQITLTVQAKAQRQPQQILDALRDDVATAEPTGSMATVRSLIEEWLEHSKARGRAPKTLHERSWWLPDRGRRKKAALARGSAAVISMPKVPV